MQRSGENHRKHLRWEDYRREDDDRKRWKERDVRTTIGIRFETGDGEKPLRPLEKAFLGWTRKTGEEDEDEDSYSSREEDIISTEEEENDDNGEVEECSFNHHHDGDDDGR